MKYLAKSDMATRWGVTRQVVNNWENRHDDFPPVEMTVDNGRMPLYTLKEVQKYERERGIAMEKTTWEFDNYTVYDEGDVLRFENNDGDVIGYVTNHEGDLIDDLNNGADPIEDGWEDGVGNTIDMDGWGNDGS